jgi:hypothetical protein
MVPSKHVPPAALGCTGSHGNERNSAWTFSPANQPPTTTPSSRDLFVEMSYPPCKIALKDRSPAFSWLTERYGDDLAVLWIDSHPDIGTPASRYSGYHAMTIAVLTGHGDSDLLALSSTVSTTNGAKSS